MLDERWSEEVEELAAPLCKLLGALSTPARIRAAERDHAGFDAELDLALRNLGLDELEGNAELFARIALELGRSLASTPFADTLPVLALTGRAGISLASGQPIAASLQWIAVERDGAVCVEPLRGTPRRTAAGDDAIPAQSLAEPPQGQRGEVLGDAELADRLRRFAVLTDSARLVGAGQGVLALGVAYARERVQFGKPIGGYQGVAHRLARASADLEAAELLLRKAAFTASPACGGDGAPAPAFSYMLQAKAVHAAREAATHVHQVFGGNGFAMEYDVQLFSRRIRSWSMRAQRPGRSLADLARLLLRPETRDGVRLLWHYDEGMPLPRWAVEADAGAGPG